MKLPAVIRVCHVGHQLVKPHAALFVVVQGSKGWECSSVATDGGGFRDALARFLEAHKLPRGPYVEALTERGAERVYTLVGDNMFAGAGIAL